MWMQFPDGVIVKQVDQWLKRCQPPGTRPGAGPGAVGTPTAEVMSWTVWTGAAGTSGGTEGRSSGPGTAGAGSPPVTSGARFWGSSGTGSGSCWVTAVAGSSRSPTVSVAGSGGGGGGAGGGGGGGAAGGCALGG